VINITSILQLFSEKDKNVPAINPATRPYPITVNNNYAIIGSGVIITTK